MTTISEQVNEIRAMRSPRPHGEPPNPFELEQVRLAAARVPEGALAAGTTIIDVDLLCAGGSPTKLFAALGETPAVVVLYRARGALTAQLRSAPTRQNSSQRSNDMAPTSRRSARRGRTVHFRRRRRTS